MPGHPEELLRPRGGTPCSEAGGRHQHHWWHLVSPLQPMEEKKCSDPWKIQYSAQLSKSITKP